jgi:AraC-like DNA-binding protein
MRQNALQLADRASAKGALLATGRFGRVMVCWAHRDIGLHAHDETQITFNMGGGALHYRIDDTVNVLRPGEAASIPAWVKHSREVDSDSPAFLVVLALSSSWIRNEWAARDILGWAGQFTVPNLLNEALAQIRASLAKPDPCNSDGLVTIVKSLVERVTNIRSPGFFSASASSGASWDKRILRAVALIQQRKGNVSVDDVAKEFELSRTHFYSLFRAHYGFSPQLFINAVRMKLAVRHLLEHDDSIADIGDMLGFSAPGHFTRFFANHTGETPFSYRTRNFELAGL